MKTKFLGIALLASAAAISTMSQDAFAASYTHDGIEYTWTCFNEGCQEGSSYIDQYQIYITPTLAGVNYYATQVAGGSGGSILSEIGIYTNDLLSPYLDETAPSPVITESSGVTFTYNAGGANNLPVHGSIFGSADESGTGNDGGLNALDEWLNIQFSYLAPNDSSTFSAGAMFNPEHYIYVHLLNTQHVTQGLGDSEKWKLTWVPSTCTGDDCGDIPVPEPGMLALMGVGMLSMLVPFRRSIKI